MDRPFVSFIVMTYNAEKFVKEAIEGAFSQTYDNLEIIISDDCSTDKTFEIIEQTVAAYTGNKPVRILRNEKNLGIGAHLNKLWWEEAKGDWIVPSAGDDISLADRTERMMLEADSQVGLIHADHYCINELGQLIERSSDYHEKMKVFETGDIRKVISSGLCVLGSCMAINKDMLKMFGPFDEGLIAEDVVLAHRAVGYGKIVHIKEPLVKYRIHRKSISYTSANFVKFSTWKEFKSDLYWKAKWKIALIGQVDKDLDTLAIEDRKFMKNRKVLAKIDWFLYGTGNFSVIFLFKKQFYLRSLKRILYPFRFSKFSRIIKLT